MVNTDTIGWAAIIGGGYLLTRELTDFLGGVPDWVQEDAKEINNAIKRERDNDNLPSSEYRKHIISAKAKYRRHYAECASKRAPTTQEVQQDIDSKNLTLEQEAWTWKMAADGMISKCREELSGAGLVNLVSENKALAAGLILSALYRQEIANFGKWAWEWMKNNDPPNNGGGGGSGDEQEETEDLGSDEAVDDITSSAQSPVFLGVVEDAANPDPEIYEPPDAPAGEPTYTGDPNSVLNIAPDWAAESVRRALDADLDAGMTWTQETLDIIAGATGVTVSFLVNNPKATIGIILVALLIAGVSTTTFGFGTPAAVAAGGAILGAIGVTVSAKNLKGLNLERTVQVE
jgi:hypothetical protein